MVLPVVFVRNAKEGKMINREEAFDLLKVYAKDEVIIKHSLAAEAVMRALAERLGYDPDRWGIAGLLHDLDYDQTKDAQARHTLQAEEILRERGVDDDHTTNACS